MKVLGALGCCALVVAVTGERAHADGAFPNSQSLLLPAGKPSEIHLVTNFGIVASSDAGRSWLWSCESDQNALGFLYQVSGPPRNRLYAVANQQLVFSDDATCGWHPAGGALGAEAATDYFLDPSDPERVIAVGLPDGGSYQVLESNDAGATFDKVLYQAAPGDFITGVEIAASDARTIYLAISRSKGIALGRTTDGGASWSITDLTSRIGGSVLRIVSVDRLDPTRVLLLVIQSGGESLVLATDGGAAVGTPLTMPAAFNSFAALPSGTLLVGGQLTAGGPLLLRSKDRGQSFEPLANPPQVVAMAARSGRLYAALTYQPTQPALAASDDEGTTWTDVMAYSDVQAILPCVKATCRTLCETQAMLGVWPEQVCVADAAPSSNGGTSGTAAGLDGGDATGETGTAASSSHGCQIAGERTSPWPTWAALFSFVAIWSRRRRVRHSRRTTDS